MTLGSLFDGSGGFPLGGMLCGITPIWASEVEPFPIRVTTKRIPQMKHFGNICDIDGGKIEPVDIITFGSPCQDLSVAGKRAGIEDGERSNLFYQAIRIIKEMRNATNGKYPTFIVWENVRGAFNSKGGRDFQSVLQSVCGIAEAGVSIPMPEKGRWMHAGEIVGDGYSVAWRVLDAQYFGVPQRRRRIYLVADFRGERAGEILFESEGLSRDTEPSEKARKRTAGTTQSSIGDAGVVCLDDEGGSYNRTGDNLSPTLGAEMVPAVFENHSLDSRYTGPLDVAQTVSSYFGTGGNNQPFVVEDVKTYDVRFTSDRTRNARQNCYQTDAPISAADGPKGPSSQMLSNPEENFVAEPVCGIDRVSYNTGENAGVAAHHVYTTSKNYHHTEAAEDVADTLAASDYKDPPTVTEEPYNIVRRLTPTECARLQGFPDWWTDGLETENPMEEELTFWRGVFDTDSILKGHKRKTDAQILKWLKNPHTDSAEYIMWGNGVALPCVYLVLSRIEEEARSDGEKRKG